jgi:hypothetical protein
MTDRIAVLVACAVGVASEFCYEALQAGDRPQARELFQREIKDQVDLVVWGSKERFAKFRAGALVY